VLLTEVLVILLLVIANGVFAGAEIAIVALRKARIEELAEEGHRAAGAVLALRQNPERFLATTQVGVTLIGSGAAAFGGAAIAHHVEPLLAKLPWLERHAEGVALALVIVVISYLSIVLGELVPKSLALRAAEGYALLVARPLRAVSWAAKPIVWLLSASANVVLKPFGDRTTFTETRHSAAELQELVEEATQAGTIPPEAGEIAARALDLPDLTVADVMVPRQSVVMISRRASREELRRVLLEHKYSRVPVYDGSVDNVIGYITVKDVLALAWEKDLIVLEDLIRAPFFVPSSKRVVALMHEMRTERLPFAIVLDEHGGVAGIATVEDLLEELVGEILSEHVRQLPNVIRRETDGIALVSGMTPIREINRQLKVELPEDGGFSTVAGLCLSLAGRVPTAGASFTLEDGTVLEVVDASPRRVRAVRVKIGTRAEAARRS
jgi:putative hemolysin